MADREKDSRNRLPEGLEWEPTESLSREKSPQQERWEQLMMQQRRMELQQQQAQMKYQRLLRPHVLSKVGEPLTREEYEAGRAVMDRLPPGIYAKCSECFQWVTDNFSYATAGVAQPMKIVCSNCGG